MKFIESLYTPFRMPASNFVATKKPWYNDKVMEGLKTKCSFNERNADLIKYVLGNGNSKRHDCIIYINTLSIVTIHIKFANKILFLRARRTD